MFSFYADDDDSFSIAIFFVFVLETDNPTHLIILKCIQSLSPAAMQEWETKLTEKQKPCELNLQQKRNWKIKCSIAVNSYRFLCLRVRYHSWLLNEVSCQGSALICMRFFSSFDWILNNFIPLKIELTLKNPKMF